MALAALDRLKDYVASLTPESVPEITQRFREACHELGRSVPSFGSPHDRIHRILERQVAQASADAKGGLRMEDQSTSAIGGKSVVFTVDVSGSMRGERMLKATDNLLTVFDQYIEDEDYVSLVTFSHMVQEVFELQEVGPSRANLRSKACDVCQAGGG